MSQYGVVYCVLCFAQHTIHTHNIHLTECFNINITLARLNCKVPDDDRRPKHVGAI